MIYLQDLFDGWLGKGAARVILPITDPYVVHHGALGSFATVYLPDGADATALLAQLRAIDGRRGGARRATRPAARFELPADRIGDIVVDLDHAQGARHQRATRHDLSGLTEPLRSHGGLTEQAVPMIANRTRRRCRPGTQLAQFRRLRRRAEPRR